MGQRNQAHLDSAPVLRVFAVAQSHYVVHRSRCIPVHGKVDVLDVGAFPEGVGRDRLDEVCLQVQVLQLAQASQHPLSQVPQLVKAHLENLRKQRPSGIILICEESASAKRGPQADDASERPVIQLPG